MIRPAHPGWTRDSSPASLPPLAGVVSCHQNGPATWSRTTISWQAPSTEDEALFNQKLVTVCGKESRFRCPIQDPLQGLFAHLRPGLGFSRVQLLFDNARLIEMVISIVNDRLLSNERMISLVKDATLILVGCPLGEAYNTNLVTIADGVRKNDMKMHSLA